MREDITNTTYAEDHSTRKRSTSTASRASSSRSTSSRESGDSSDRARRGSVPSSPQPRHHKSTSFSRLLGTKEPSLDSFKQLAELQQKELEKKGQSLPFGVPQTKLPSSVKDDYKKAKQRAKERARMHDAIKEKMKQNEQESRHPSHLRNSSSSSLAVDDDHLAPPTTTNHVPASPRSANSKRFSALDPLPEGTIADAAADSTRSPKFPSSPRSNDFARSGPRPNDVLKGDARKEALPWE